MIKTARRRFLYQGTRVPPHNHADSSCRRLGKSCLRFLRHAEQRCGDLCAGDGLSGVDTAVGVAGERADRAERVDVPAQDTSSVELPFADSNRIADWAKDGVRAMYALGVTKGSYDGYGRLCFLPTATISRQEALTMLGRLLELGYAAPEWSFTDSDAIADWARGHIDTLCGIGALSGYADGGIHPTEPITRAQVAATLFSMT